MEQIFVNGVPLSETLLKVADKPENESKGQKFVRVHQHQELHITACAVSKMASVDRLSELEEYNNYFVEPNQKWLENQSDPFAWVKIYCKINPKNDSVIIGQVQTVITHMTFLGESHKECWGEIQFCIKKQIIRNGIMINLKNVKLGRNACFDTRVGKWVEETEPIVPKKGSDSHEYIALRLYHQGHSPENQPDWHFEPLFVYIAGKSFYRIDATWQSEEITIIATKLNNDSSEIPKFLRL
ncbi:MAG: hypothetical protein Q7K16_01015 [Candidatus Azambacteria bacterium]|nr:hypothetical protein [Candidatus Azambacteria bacterium]